MAFSDRATIVGASSILMWATLASLTSLSAEIPPFQLTAMAFTLAFLIGLALWVRQGGSLRLRLQLPVRVWLLGIYGLFGYHFLYFMALRNAPAVEASLIAYLWPMLIVLFSAALPGQRLRWFHILGSLIAFSGAALLVTGGRSLAFHGQYLVGYLLALACAFTWASYSVLSRHFKVVPTNSVAGFCFVTAALAFVCHLIFESTVWPTGWNAWLVILLLGLGPVGAAFYTWDYGVKNGNLITLGAFSYTAPLLSTLLLVVLGLAQLTWFVALACLFIVGGAFLVTAEPQTRRSVG